MFSAECTVAFRVSHRRREMYSGYGRLCVCVCVSVCPRPHAPLLHGPADVTWGNDRDAH